MSVPDLRAKILGEAIAILREHGLAGLTQPRVAKAAGVTQSHLTYYFPTRADLLAAVLERAAAGQRAGIGAALAAAPNGPEALADALGDALSRPENTRVLVSLVLAADADPAFRTLYRSLAGGVRGEVGEALAALGVTADPATVTMVHALGTGLAVLGLALGPEEAGAIAARALTDLFRLLQQRVPAPGRGEPS
ncbi:TetR/AcrR family transcriptional regulator [Segnochrobactrum spirostomi]|uniref:TetR/AcrR family transcriptional regulator n=1 Tax=Segnochrobactrum spirostomi TaxID=2608987 RepID=UPI001AD82202|nr:TetR/AcrR family transcriptional regulator [Segnochrobactrum spirostomi]